MPFFVPVVASDRSSIVGQSVRVALPDNSDEERGMAEARTRRQRPLTRLQVTATEWLSPHMIRVVAGGPGFATFIANEYTDRYVKLVFLKSGIDYPEPLEMQFIQDQLPREAWPTTRTYTVRWYDEAAQELAIDFVYHGDVGIAGPWAAALKPGDDVIFAGPGGAYAPSGDADWHLLVGDESALPAIGAALSAMPAGAHVRAFVEVADGTEEQQLPSPADVELRWLHRSAGAPDDLLVRAVQDAEFPSGQLQAFVHGEAGSVRALRRHLLEDRGVAKEQLSLSGYWRRGKNEDGWQAEKREQAAAEREAATTR
jgi:NADPH-dependent ferric siderophore reductase